jgi:integrase
MASIVKKIRQKGLAYFVVYRVDGKQRWKYAGRRKIDAERLKSRIEHEICQGTYQEIPDITFEAFARKFLQAHAVRVREKTLATYSSHLETRIIPYFAGRKLKSIRAIDIESFLAHLKNQGVTPATSAKYLRTLKLVLKRACQWKFLVENPAEYIKPPRVERKEMDCLDPQEVRKLIAATDERYRVLVMTACYTGLRQGELLGLKWEDIDFKSNRIFVRRTWQEGRFYEPKSKYSRRAVVVPPVLMEALKEHQARQLVDGPISELGLVFPNEAGKPLDRHNLLTRVLWPALTRAGLRRIRWHDLRHSYAATLISRGENIKFVQKQLGHSSIQITLDIYGHLLPETEKDAAQRIETAFGEERAERLLSRAV